MTAEAGVFTPIASVVVRPPHEEASPDRGSLSITSFSSRSRSALWNATPPAMHRAQVAPRRRGIAGSVARSSACCRRAGGRASPPDRRRTPVVSPLVVAEDDDLLLPRRRAPGRAGSPSRAGPFPSGGAVGSSCSRRSLPSGATKRTSPLRRSTPSPRGTGRSVPAEQPGIQPALHARWCPDRLPRERSAAARSRPDRTFNRVSRNSSVTPGRWSDDQLGFVDHDCAHLAGVVRNGREGEWPNFS